MLSRSNTVILSAAILVAVAGGWLQHASRQAHRTAGVPSLEVGDVRPALALPDIDGRNHALSDYRAHRVLLNFWASWCGPCLDEMPALAKAQAKFGEKALNVVGIAMDDPVQVRGFLTAHPVPYPILIGRLDPPNTSLRLGNAAQVLPYSVLLDEHGKVLAMQQGALTAEQLDAWLR